VKESYHENKEALGNYGNTETSGEDSSDSDSEASDDKPEEPTTFYEANQRI
jgi:hypothetical protein